MIKVTVLGRASAKPTAKSHPSAQVVNVNEQYYLVDAGEGTQQQMFRMGINPLKLRAVFISHLHGDHVFGLFPMLSTMGLCGRQMPLKVYAPRPFGEILEYHLRYFDSQLPYEVEWVEVDTTSHQIIFENKTLEVWSVPLRHRVPCSGYHFKEKEPQLNVDKFKKLVVAMKTEQKDNARVSKMYSRVQKQYNEMLKRYFTIANKVVDKMVELLNKDTYNGLKVGIMTTKEHCRFFTKGEIICLGNIDDGKEIAKHLFAALRQFDELNVDVIYSEAFSEEGIGHAVMNRLNKAAGHRTILVK